MEEARIACTRIIYASNLAQQLVFYWMAKDDLSFRTFYLILAYGLATYQAASLQFQNMRYYGVLQAIYELGQFLGFYFLWNDSTTSWKIASGILFAFQLVLCGVLLKLEAPPEKPKRTYLIVIGAITRMVGIVFFSSSGLLYLYLDEDSRFRGGYYRTLQIIFLLVQSVWSISEFNRLQTNRYQQVEDPEKKQTPTWMYVQAIIFGIFLIVFILSTYIIAIVQIHEGGNPTYDNTIYILIVVSNSLLLSCFPILGCCYMLFKGSVDENDSM